MYYFYEYPDDHVKDAIPVRNGFNMIELEYTEKNFFMNSNNDIPEVVSSVTFNPYKHHLGFLKMKITLWQKKEWPETAQEIRSIGNNLIDLYYGQLTVGEIYNEVNKFAESNCLTSPGRLADWLNPFKYKKLRLPDGSMWVIKQGKNSTRFLHIHPAKYSPHTIRIKAPTLKTVIALQVLIGDMKKADLTALNRIRKEKLNLSPIKTLQAGKGIARLIANFNSL